MGNPMRRLLCILLLIVTLIPPARARAAAAQDVASYQIDVTLDPQTKVLQGQETITYTNVSQQSIPDLAFHLYLNAFRSTETIFMQESGSSHRGFTYDTANPGSIEITALRTGTGEELTLTLVEDGTLATAELPEPLLPGETLTLEVSFTARLPRVFARTGFAVDAAGDLFFMVGQWFPKLGVWQDGDWNAYPFHANAEFFADFGDYTVSIRLPEEYVVGASGIPTGQVAHGDGTQTLTFFAEDVIDFAWSASPNFKVASRQVGSVEALYLYLPEHESTVDRALEIIELSLLNYGEWYGEYPYPRLTVIDVPASGRAAGGMEYPTLITGEASGILGQNPNAGGFVDRNLELVIAHEIAHQWWQSMVAFNEAEEPWLDEGFTDYSAARLFDVIYPGGKAFEFRGAQVSYFEMRRMEYVLNPDIPMLGRAWDFAFLDYATAAYSKSAVALSTLESVLGDELMLEVMSTFFQEYQYAHPTTEDFRRTAESVSGQDLSWFFDGLVETGATVNYRVVSVGPNQAVIEKQGDLEVPLTVRVEFESGSVITETWAADGPSLTLTYPDSDPIRYVQIDPGGELRVDLNSGDNGMAAQVQIPAFLAVFVRMLYQIQNLLLSLGGQ